MVFHWFYNGLGRFGNVVRGLRYLYGLIQFLFKTDAKWSCGRLASSCGDSSFSSYSKQMQTGLVVSLPSSCGFLFNPYSKLIIDAHTGTRTRTHTHTHTHTRTYGLTTRPGGIYIYIYWSGGLLSPGALIGAIKPSERAYRRVGPAGVREDLAVRRRRPVQAPALPSGNSNEDRAKARWAAKARRAVHRRCHARRADWRKTPGDGLALARALDMFGTNAKAFASGRLL